jgi:hypothetical protein
MRQQLEIKLADGGRGDEIRNSQSSIQAMPLLRMSTSKTSHLDRSTSDQKASVCTSLLFRQLHANFVDNRHLHPDCSSLIVCQSKELNCSKNVELLGVAKQNKLYVCST